jgi:hypothetical protein
LVPQPKDATKATGANNGANNVWYLIPDENKKSVGDQDGGKRQKKLVFASFWFSVPSFVVFLLIFRLSIQLSPGLTYPVLMKKITLTKQSISPLLGVIIIFVNLARF